MTATTRVRRIEVALTAADAILAWLDRALAFPSVAAYAEAMLVRDDHESPMAFMRRTLARGLHADPDRPTYRERYRRESADASLLFHLVRNLQDQADANGVLYEQALARHGLQLRMSAGALHPRRALTEDDERVLREWAEASVTLLEEVVVQRSTRLAVEERWLRGRNTLFLETRRRWEGVEMQEAMLEIVLEQPQVAAVCPPRRTPAEIGTAIAGRVQHTFEDAQLATLMEVGNERAVLALSRRLAQASPVAVAPDATWDVDPERLAFRARNRGRLRQDYRARRRMGEIVFRWRRLASEGTPWVPEHLTRPRPRS